MKTTKENLMTEETQEYSPGSWIVHRHHGIGQIKGTEIRHISGRKNKYYKIRTHNSTLWIPKEKLNEDCLRPLVLPAELQQALEILKSPPRPMDTDISKRRSRFNEAKTNNSPVIIAELLRDLTAHNKERKQVSQTDGEALRYFMDLFLTEWSVCMSLEMGIVRQQFDDLLSQA